MFLLRLFFFAVVFAFVASITVQAQDNRLLLSYEEAKTTVQALPKFFEQYKYSRSVLAGKFATAQEVFQKDPASTDKSAANDLLLWYMRVRDVRQTPLGLWVVFHALSQNQDLLLQDGWTQAEINSATLWLSKYPDIIKRMKKIDSSSPTDDQVEVLLREMGVDPVLFIFAGLFSPAFLFHINNLLS